VELEEAFAMLDRHAIGRSVGRCAAVFLVACIVSATASAYTIVMRGGRRIEIPSSFIVTPSTLAYEVSAGMQVTLNVAAIDIAATETANNERPGSFLRRVPATLIEAQLRPNKARTITNSDLELSVRRRRESERTYERRRKELGLPSVEESRKQTEAESAVIAGELEQTRASERESESYWRERAAGLRTEIAALDAEIRYVRSQLDEPLYSYNGAFTNSASVLPFISFGNTRRLGPFSQQGMQPRVFAGPRTGAQLGGRVAFGGGATRGQVFVNPSRQFPRSRRFGFSQFTSSNVFATSFQPYDYSFERGQLITQFNELNAARAGLGARWRELEDEARRAGAPPGWLRP